MLGVTGAPLLITAIGAALVGFVASVIVNLLFMVLLHLTSMLTQIEFSETPIGCSASDTLSGTLGGLTGVIGALIMLALPLEHDATHPRTFFVCWSVSAVIPILGTLVLVMHARVHER